MKYWIENPPVYLVYNNSMNNITSTMTDKFDVCEEPGCNNKHYARGWCSRHWQLARRAGIFVVDPDWRKRSKPRQRVYRGSGKHITPTGYVKIRLGPGNWQLEHRLVMEQRLGRELYPDENVHHIDGDRQNNAPDNLELWVTRQPQGSRPEDLLAWAHQIIDRYG